MVSIVYKSLSSLSPIELKYQYYKDEELIKKHKQYQEEYSLIELEGLKQYQDIAINKNSCFVLTSSVNLSNVFEETTLEISKRPFSVILQPRNSLIYFIKFNENTNTFQPTLTSSSHFFVQPTENKNEVELFVNKQYVQIDEDYPYVARLNSRSLDPEFIHRQRFLIHYENNFISFATKTNNGYRYLAFNNDNNLKGIGVMFNDSIVNDYFFKCYPVTDVTSKPGFIPSNNLVTYYFDIESQIENQTIKVNKNIQEAPTNLLFDFPIESAVESGTAFINIANLKTYVTPTGGPASIDNSYPKQFTTKN